LKFTISKKVNNITYPETIYIANFEKFIRLELLNIFNKREKLNPLNQPWEMVLKLILNFKD